MQWGMGRFKTRYAQHQRTGRPKSEVQIPELVPLDYGSILALLINSEDNTQESEELSLSLTITTFCLAAEPESR